jgi:hypothetical protein
LSRLWLILGVWGTAAQAAGTFSGMGLPEQGGGFSGPAEPGVLGVGTNPAAARSLGLEALVDVGILGSHFSAKLAGEAPEANSSSSAVPYLAFTAPLGRHLGLGGSISVPYGRGGSATPDGSQRFHGIEGSMVVGRADLSLSVVPLPWLTVGGGAVAEKAIIESEAAVDTGAMLYELLGTDEFIGQELLEGTREVRNFGGTGFGGTLGFVAEHASGVQLHGAWRSSVRVPVVGDVSLVPSSAFELQIDGEVRGDLIYPAELHGALTVPLGPVRATAELAWVGWSAASERAMVVEDTSITSGDAVLEAMLSSYGLDEPEALGKINSLGATGYRNTLGGGGRLVWQDGAWGALVGANYAPASVPDAWVHPGSVDFDSIDLRAGIRRRLWRGVELGLSGAWVAAQDRHIENSEASFLADPSEAPVVPPSNGVYKVGLWRAGLSLIYRSKGA